MGELVLSSIAANVSAWRLVTAKRWSCWPIRACGERTSVGVALVHDLRNSRDGLICAPESSNLRSSVKQSISMCGCGGCRFAAAAKASSSSLRVRASRLSHWMSLRRILMMPSALAVLTVRPL